MQFSGLLVGAFSFAVIGLFHPIVIKCEYHFSHRVWPAFLLTGLLLLAGSLLCGSPVAGALLGVAGFACLWSIGELKTQRKRVERGWFPENPKRRAVPGAAEQQAE